MNYEFGYVIAFQTKTNRGRDPGVLHPAEFLTFPELLRRFSIKGFRFWMELMARNVYTRQNDNYEIYFWILYVQNSEIRKYSLWILLVKMCWVRKLSKSEYKSNSISTYFKPDCKTNIVPIVCHSQCELGNLFGGKDILNVRIKTQTMEFAGDNNKTDWGGWIERRLSISIYGAEVKGPQPASPPYQYTRNSI